MKKIFISVGEISGDNYASELIKLLPDFEWVGITGPKMREAGCKTVENLEDISVVGITEALPKYLKIKKAFKKAVSELDKGVDMLIVVDFPGFNLKLLEEAKKRGIKTVYFIAPQVWAWGKGRIPKIVKNTDILISIWPFEKNIYSDYLGSFRFEYVGHPLLDIVKTETDEKEFKEKLGIEQNKKIFGLLAGSRESEVKTLLPIMLKSTEIMLRKRSDLHFVIPSTPNTQNIVKQLLSDKNLPVSVIIKKDFKNPSYEVMRHSIFSVIASGTATLEASIIGNPFLLVYKVSPITFFIGKMLVSIKYLGLPNIIADREVIKELLQKECNPENIAEYSLRYLEDKQLYEKTKKDLQQVRQKLGEGGALYRTARIIESSI
ncbi:lipid-A-disaccharide synthase [Persephonella hydrogeniphila]|uniref:Lipid-A-disaccharide synthase n=1 Tax=Persephonella hydrogeniphila TaxID=198703 RepID=A0A285NG98_9AQUI|nr:lipid-A-disaccharide synthase [Persephonella hydrogeniphila]SNZ08479.1 lipid-A-disaccharide synthase [Persephonella hydrogeniphila]